MPDRPVTAADVLAAEIGWAVASGDAAEIGVYLVDALLAAGYHVVREGEAIRPGGTLARWMDTPLTDEQAEAVSGD
jgi:hypothetical protein